MYNDQLRRRLPEKRKPKVFYSCTECNPYLSGLSLSSPPTADSPASDTFLEGKFKITLLDGGILHRDGGCLKEERHMRLYPVTAPADELPYFQCFFVDEDEAQFPFYTFSPLQI